MAWQQTESIIDRTEASRALAKVLAYKNVGKEKDAEEWFFKLANVLGYDIKGGCY